MIQIRTLSGFQFDLSPDFSLSIEETSVMIGKKGSFSLPLDLPFTDNNLRNIGFPNRIDRKKKFTNAISVVVSSGSWIRHARLDVESLQQDAIISCALFFSESAFYAKIKNLDLKTIFKNKIRDDYSLLAIDQKITAWLDYFEKIECGDASDDFYIFPVCAQKKEYEKSGSSGTLTVSVKFTEFIILNRPDVPDKDYGGVLGTSLSGQQYYRLAARKSWTVKSDPLDDKSDDIIYPHGYGVTPFLKFSFVLRYIFTYLGYQLETSEFDSDISFQKKCLLNNTADAVMKGTIDYSQLVPDKNVIDFFEYVENTYAVEFVVDEVNKKVTPRFWKDLLLEDATGNLDQNFEDFPNVDFPASMSVKLTTSKSAFESEKVEFKTYHELFRQFSPALSTDMNPFPHCVLDKKTFKYMCYKWLKYGLPDGGITYVRQLENIVDDNLDYYNNDNEDNSYDERDCGFESIPMIKVSLSGKSPISMSVSGQQTYVIYQLLPSELTAPEYSIPALIPYINSIRHFNTVIQSTKTQSDGQNTVSAKPEPEQELEIFPCFYVGFAQPDSSYPGVEKTFYSSTHKYDNVGNVWGNFDLTTLSIYERFFKSYDEVISSSFYEIYGKAYMNESEMIKLNFDKIMTFRGQKVLPVSLQYEISNEAIEISELRVKVVKKYE